MPESYEKRELGGLARSIDALFSQTTRARAVEVAEPQPVATAGSVEVPVDPDPFESLDAHVVGPPEPDDSTPDPVLEFAATQSVVEESFEAQPPQAPAGLDFAEPGSAHSGLEGAVEEFLAGEAGAADEVRAVSAKLRERLALDPLADAVARLVGSSGAAPRDEAVALALEVINPAVASRLVQRMGHEEDEGRRAEYVALSQSLGMVMVKAFRGALTGATEVHARRVYYDALIAMGETSRPVIEGMVDDENRFLVRNAVALLGEIGGERALELVTSQLANTDARVRGEAIGSLAKLGGEDSAQLVLASLEDPDAKVRAAAAVAAGELRVERALRSILTLLDQEEDPSVVVTLLGALGRLGDPGAVVAIEKRAVASLFSKPVTEVRVAAYRALHEIGTPHARQLIQQAREDKDPVVRTTTRGMLLPD